MCKQCWTLFAKTLIVIHISIVHRKAEAMDKPATNIWKKSTYYQQCDMHSLKTKRNWKSIEKSTIGNEWVKFETNVRSGNVLCYWPIDIIFIVSHRSSKYCSSKFKTFSPRLPNYGYGLQDFNYGLHRYRCGLQNYHRGWKYYRCD